MKNVEKFIRPTNISELLEARAKEENNILLAGGTSLIFSKDASVRTIIDMSEVNELKNIEFSDGKLKLGAMVTMTQLRHRSDLPVAIRNAALSVASTPIRNVVTVGGEVMRGVYWNDLPVALMALDAVAVFASTTGERAMPLEEVFSLHPTKTIRPDEVLTRVELTDYMRPAAFHKFSKTATDYAIASIAFSARSFEGSTVREPKVVVGAVTPLPRRLNDVERLLSEKGESALEELETLFSGFKTRPDFRVSAEYQRNLMIVGIRRLFRAARDGGEE